MNKIEKDRIAVRDGLPKGLAGNVLLTIFENHGTLACVAGELFYRLFVITPKPGLIPCGGVHKYPYGQSPKEFLSNNRMLGYVIAVAPAVKSSLFMKSGRPF